MKPMRVWSFALVASSAFYAGIAWPQGTATPPAGNPVPELTGIQPAEAVRGAAQAMFTLTGSGFKPASQVKVAGKVMKATRVNDTTLKLTLSGKDLQEAGTLAVTVENPAPGGGTSAAFEILVKNPAPEITGLNPAQVQAGAALNQVTVNGRGFLDTTQILLDGSATPVIFKSATTLLVTVDGGKLKSAGAVAFKAVNAAPGGGESAVKELAVVNPVPVLKGLEPAVIILGGKAKLTLKGAGFVAESKVSIGAESPPVTWGGPGELSVEIPAAVSGAAGKYPVQVVNGEPKGGKSVAVQLTVNNPKPELSAVSPNGVLVEAGDTAFTLSGSGFVAGSVVLVDGKPTPAAFKTGGELSVALSAPQFAGARTLKFAVRNDLPGGGQSAAVDVPITYPTPTLSGLNPAEIRAESGAFELAVNGSGFVKNTKLLFDGKLLTVSAREAMALKAQVPALFIAKAGTATVKVENPAPGGGAAAASFAILNPVPKLKAVAPTQALAGSQQAGVDVAGSGFVQSTRVLFGGTAVPATLVNEGLLRATVPAGVLATAGPVEVKAETPAPGGGESAAVTFTVMNPAPVPETIAPAQAMLNATDVRVTVTGRGFVNTSKVTVDGQPADTEFGGPNKLVVTLPAGVTGKGGTAKLGVVSPEPGGGSAGAIAFTIMHPVPKPEGVSPGEVPLYTESASMTIAGADFVPGATVNVGGVGVAATVVSPQEIKFEAGKALLGGVRKLLVTVTNPGPGGGAGKPTGFDVVNPVPAIESVSPAAGLVQNADRLVTLTGSNFVPASAVVSGGTRLAATFQGPTKIQVRLPAAMVNTAKEIALAVQSPQPGGGNSNEVTHTVTNPEPKLTKLSATEGLYLGPELTLDVTGENFVKGLTAAAGSAPVEITWLGATQAKVKISAAVLKTAGAADITVTNAGPGGGQSNALGFVVKNPAPKLTKLAIDKVVKGGAAFEVELQGSDFVPAAQVLVDGETVATQFRSPGAIVGTLTGAQLAEAKVLKIAASNPGPGGGKTPEMPFTVENPVPEIGSLSPAKMLAEKPAFVLSLSGKNYVPASKIWFGAEEVPTTFISASSLSAQIAASFIREAGTIAVTVKNPAPGGGVSQPKTFSVAYQISTIAGTGIADSGGDRGPAPAATFNYPAALAMDATGNLFVVESVGNRVRKISPGNRQVMTEIGTGRAEYAGDGVDVREASLNRPAGIAIDRSGNIYIADTENHLVQRLNALTRKFEVVAGTPSTPGRSGDGGPAKKAQLNTPTDVAVDARDQLYIADLENNVIRKVDLATGAISTFAGTGVPSDGGDGGPAIKAQLNNPRGIAVDRSGNLYIADRYNNRVRRVRADGVIETFAGTGDRGFAGDGGPAPKAQLALPSHLAVAPDGSVYVTDSRNNRIRKIDGRTGVISTVVGSGEDGFFGDGGQAPEARLKDPNGIFVDSSGALFIADSGNHRIRKVGKTQ